jgi:hypothetical protein
MTLQIIIALVFIFTAGAYVGMAMADSENKKDKALKVKLYINGKLTDSKDVKSMQTKISTSQFEPLFSQKKKAEEKRIAKVKKVK